jgi:hypothetical protein
MPHGWPGYGRIAAPIGRKTEKIQVKTPHGNSWFGYHESDEFDWIVAVLTANSYSNPTSEARVFIIPREIADAKQHRHANGMLEVGGLRHVVRYYAAWENNFSLNREVA